MIEEEGLENVFARHALLARATRAGAAALGLELFGDPDERSNVVTAVELPETIDGGKVPGALRKLGITANGGQDHLKGKILRIAHCGYFGAFDILTSLSGLEMVAARSSATRSSTAPASAPRSGCSSRPASRPPRERARPSSTRSSSRRRSPTPASTCCASASTSTSASTGADEELAERIGDYHGDPDPLGHASSTADLIERADNLKVIGRAGIGVDNVDVEAATKRGIIVANAPQSNIVAAAEHTVALMLALARNIPQAHGSLTAGKWERSKFGGVEVYEKTLGVLGFGRIGQLVADPRARLRHARRRLRPVRVRRALPRARRREGRDARRRLRAAPTSSRSTCPRRPRRAAGSTPRRSRR